MGKVGTMSDSQNSEYLVCFYDFLGQREWMASAVKKGKVVPGKQSELDLIASSTMRACQIVKNRAQEFSNATSVKLSEGVDYGILQFSDSTVIFVRKEIERAPELFYNILLDVSLHALEWQSVGFGVRGGITIGLVWPVVGGTICGPALDEVVDLEGRTAYWQRIVFSDRFVQWIGKEMVDEQVVQVRKGGLLSLNSIIHWGIDTEGFLNIFSEPVMQRMKVAGEEEKYKHIFEKAQGFVSRTLWECKKPYVWKYFFADDAYDWDRRKVDFHGSSDKADYKQQDYILSNVEVGQYLVYYIKLLPLSVIPRDKTIMESGFCNAGYAAASPVTVKLLQYSLVQMSVWKRDWKNRLPETSIGIQQVGNYIMIYVKDDVPESYLAFISAVRALDNLHLWALQSQHFSEASIVLGNGWEVSENCLCGPIVGEADSLATKNVPYPRVAISEALHVSMSQRLISGVGLKLNGKVKLDIDGCWVWDVYGDLPKRKDVLGISPNDYIKGVFRHYIFRYLFMWHFRFRNNEGSAFARQMHLVIRQLMGKIEEWGLGDLYREAEKAAIDDLKAIEPLAPGDYPWILGRYVDIPTFTPRTGSSWPWMNFAPPDSAMLDANLTVI